MQCARRKLSLTIYGIVFERMLLSKYLECLLWKYDLFFYLWDIFLNCLLLMAELSDSDLGKLFSVRIFLGIYICDVVLRK